MSQATTRDADGRAMLRALGLADAEELFSQIPDTIRLKRPLSLPGPMSEIELTRLVLGMSSCNLHAGAAVCLAGGGVYDHFRPAVVDSVMSRGEFLTAYTAYQPEISQGFLTAMYEFQTMVCELYGLEVANASLYDAGTAIVEAVLLAREATKRPVAVVLEPLNPRYLACLRTCLGPDAAAALRPVPHRDGVYDREALTAAVGDETACVVIQQPSFLGTIQDVEAVASIARAAGAKTIVCADPIAVGILEPPGACGAEIAVGEGQPLGLPMGYGGPLLGLFATTEDLVRRLPGRVVGRTVDRDGRAGYVLTLQTREQHIRREKATSNICTNQGLCALGATVYLCAVGPRGLRRVASLCVVRSHELRDVAASAGLRPIYDRPFFREFAVQSPMPVAELQRRMGERGFILGGDVSAATGVENSLLLCATEMRTSEEIARFGDAVREVL